MITLPTLPDRAITALILLGVEAVLVFLASQHVMMLRGKLGIASGIAVVYRLVLFTFGLLIVTVFGFFSVSPIFAAAQIAFAVVEAALLFLYWPRIYQSMSGTALGTAVMGGLITMFGMGMAGFSLFGGEWRVLLGGAVIATAGGFMLYSAIKKMMAGE